MGELGDKMLKIQHIITLLHYLHSELPSSLEQFMFILDLSGAKNARELVKELKENQEAIASSNVQVIFDGPIVVISNKNCKISGWGNDHSLIIDTDESDDEDKSSEDDYDP